HDREPWHWHTRRREELEIALLEVPANQTGRVERPRRVQPTEPFTVRAERLVIVPRGTNDDGRGAGEGQERVVPRRRLDVDAATLERIGETAVALAELGPAAASGEDDVLAHERGDAARSERSKCIARAAPARSNTGAASRRRPRSALHQPV